MLEEKKLKLDFGCGMKSRVGFEGVDRSPLSLATHIIDLMKFPLPWKDSSWNVEQDFRVILLARKVG